MKLQPDRQDDFNAITAYSPGGITVNGQEHRASLVIPWRGELRPWPCRALDELTAGLFESLLALEPELVIFGSGTRLRFPSPALLRPLIERGIGIETMDTAAACRTYNVLAGEDRRVVAALLLEAPSEAGAQG